MLGAGSVPCPSLLLVKPSFLEKTDLQYKSGSAMITPALRKDAHLCGAFRPRGMASQCRKESTTMQAV